MIVTRTPFVGVARHYIEPLLEAHYQELGNTQRYELAPNYNQYHYIADAGNLIMLLAFDEDVCVGYSVNFLSPHVHYMRQRVCSNDVLFVAKDYREGSIGGRLMARTAKEAKAAGATVLHWHAKPNTALFTILSKRSGPIEYIFAQSL